MPAPVAKHAAERNKRLTTIMRSSIPTIFVNSRGTEVNGVRKCVWQNLGFRLEFRLAELELRLGRGKASVESSVLSSFTPAAFRQRCAPDYQQLLRRAGGELLQTRRPTTSRRG